MPVGFAMAVLKGSSRISGSSHYGFCVCVINCLTDSPERMGKVAPSVFGGIGSGAETAIEKPKPPATSVFGK